MCLCAHLLTCVRVIAATLVLHVFLSLSYSCAFVVINIVRTGDSNLWRFLANGKRLLRKKTMVLKVDHWIT
jgi:hypothetical protein